MIMVPPFESTRQLRQMPPSRAHSPPAFDPVLTVPGALDAGVLILCDHARNDLPASYGTLGLSEAQLGRHIAYDIGAEALTRQMAQSLGAPAVLAGFSRLLIDPNRGADDPTLVMRLSDGAVVPGNAWIDEAEIARRRAVYWRPYRAAIASTIEAMMASGVIPALVSVHSFTAHWKGRPRPWHVGVLWDKDPRLALPFLAALAGEADIVVGDNEPYDGALEGDTLYENATRRGLANLLIEVRQDLIEAPADAAAWGERIASLLQPVLARAECHRICHCGSRGEPRRSQG
jgi:predicted N-formylglutamate amidohydrolase